MQNSIFILYTDQRFKIKYKRKEKGKKDIISKKKRTGKPQQNQRN